MPQFDVVGVGLNATDTLLIVPHFPAYAGKVPFQEELLSPGGQVASAMVACASLGLRVKYIGAIGDDQRGRIQMDSLLWTGINLDDVQLCRNCPNQSAYIIIDRSTGERTVLWRHDDCLRIDPDRILPEQIANARLLHLDGYDTAAAARAASIARSHGIPVTADVDTIYHGFDRVLPNIDYLVASSEFPAAWTGVNDPFRALETIQSQYGMKVAAMTLGAHGALALESRKVPLLARFRGELPGYHRRGRRVSRGVLLCCFAGHADARCARTLQRHGGPQLHRAGRPGGIRGHEEVRALMARAERRAHPEFAARAALES